MAVPPSQSESRPPRQGRRQFPRLRAVTWVGAMVSAGLLVVLLFFSFIGEVNFAYAYLAGVLMVCLAAYFFLTWITFERSEVTGNTRPADRERRGF